MQYGKKTKLITFIILITILFIVLWCDRQENSERELPDLSGQDILPAPEWARKGILYEIFPRVFSEQGTFAAIEKRLDHIQNLGVNIIWLMPIYPTGQKNKKGTVGSPYAVKDFRAINSVYGNETDFRKLVDEIHRRNMKIILDIVPNHAAHDNHLLEVHPDWFMRDKQGRFTREKKEWSDVIDFNYDNPDLRNYMQETLLFWINEFDIDGYRCDVAGRVPYDFWTETLPHLRRAKPDIYLLAEWEDPEILLSGFDSDYGWTEYHALDDIRNGKLRTAAVLGILQEIEQKYPRNHLRLRFLENHDQKRSMEIFGAQAIEAYASLLFTLPGLPLLYAGQELGEIEKPSLFEKSTIHWLQGDSALLTMYQELIHLRKSNPSLTQGSFMQLPVASLSGSVGAFVRWEDSSAALILSNLRNKTAEKIVISLTGEQQVLLDAYSWTSFKSADDPPDFRELYFDKIEGFTTRIYIGKK
ncbi:MAG: alpha-galactosidase [bacterium]|nr:MAG: alpha-galactosidase [bacterium]